MSLKYLDCCSRVFPESRVHIDGLGVVEIIGASDTEGLVSEGVGGASTSESSASALSGDTGTGVSVANGSRMAASGTAGLVSSELARIRVRLSCGLLAPADPGRRTDVRGGDPDPSSCCISSLGSPGRSRDNRSVDRCLRSAGNGCAVSGLVTRRRDARGVSSCVGDSSTSANIPPLPNESVCNRLSPSDGGVLCDLRRDRGDVEVEDGSDIPPTTKMIPLLPTNSCAAQCRLRDDTISTHMTPIGTHVECPTDFPCCCSNRWRLG